MGGFSNKVAGGMRNVPISRRQRARVLQMLDVAYDGSVLPSNLNALVWDEEKQAFNLLTYEELPVRAGTAAALDTETGTTIITAGTYYPIEGTFTPSVAVGFDAATVNTPGIKYTSTTTQYFEVDWHTTLHTDVATTTVLCGIKKNGVLVPSSIMSTLCKNLGEAYNMSGTCVLELGEGDEIQLVVSSDGNGDVISFENYITTIRSFF